MRTQVVSLLPLFVAGALLVGSCGGSDEVAEPTESAVTEPPATSAAQATVAPTPTSVRAAAQEIERDPAPELPGKHVDLQSIYDGVYANPDGNNTAAHVASEVDYRAQGLPPAGGPHWSGGCGDDPSSAPPFCGPARWGIYRAPWEEETVVHNMEHGGVVVWYHTDDQQIVDSLEAVVIEALEDSQLVVMMPYPAMEDDTIALTSWARRDKFQVSEYTDDRVREYIDVHERRFNPENF